MANFIKSSTNGHSEANAPEMADAIRKVDQAKAIPRSNSVDKFYVEYQTDEAEKEQHEAYAAQAESEAASAEKKIAELDHRATKAERASDRADGLAAKEVGCVEVDRKVLRQHCRRRNHAKLVYWLWGLLLVLGDVAGASGAILILGEEPFNAYAQATSVAVSALILGAAGTAAKHWIAANARQKPLEDLTDEEWRCSSFFTGPDSYVTAVKVLGLAFIAGMVAIVGGIFTLRQAAEGQQVAIAFGCFAFALCIASFLRGFEYACEVSDYLEADNSNLKQFEKVATEASSNPVIASYNGARAEAKSIRERCETGSRAASHGLRREMYGVLNEHPEIAGHGTAPGSSKDQDGATDGRRDPNTEGDS